MKTNYINMNDTDYSALVYAVFTPEGDYVDNGVYGVNTIFYEDNGRNRAVFAKSITENEKYKNLTLDEENDYNLFVLGETNFFYLYNKEKTATDRFVHEREIAEPYSKYEVAIMTVEKFYNVVSAATVGNLKATAGLMERFKKDDDKVEAEMPAENDEPRLSKVVVYSSPRQAETAFKHFLETHPEAEKVRAGEARLGNLNTLFTGRDNFDGMRFDEASIETSVFLNKTQKEINALTSSIKQTLVASRTKTK